MTSIEAIKNRHSVRAYKEMPIPADLRQQIETCINQCNQEGKLHLQLICDEPKAFNSTMARYGKFVGVANYIACIGSGKHLDERIGYYGEKIVLLAQELGLNTCWVGMTFSKQPHIMHIDKGEKLVCVISIGYGKNQGAGHKIKTFDEVTKNAQDAPQWFRNGVETALLAPTAVNQQKFTFKLLPDNRVKAKSGIGFFAKVDVGIAKLHFELGAGKENFSWEE